MARRIPAERFSDLIHAASEVFIQLGYRRCQMADVAAALGVAKGTLYGYVESKEALFQVALRYADADGPIALPDTLPVPTPQPGALLRELRTRTAREGALPALQQALARPRATNLRAELEGILRELYAVLQRNRRGIKLIDRCALDHPDFDKEWQREGREAPRAALARYLESRARTRQLRPMIDPQLTARFVIETITTWTVHIHWDRWPQRLDDKAVAETVITFLLNGLLRDPK